MTRGRPEGGVGISAVADGDADRVALLLEDLSHPQQFVPGLRRLLEPGLLEVRLVVRGRERDPEPRDAFPAGLRLMGLCGERIPPAILLPELVDDVTDVDEHVM